MSDKNSAEAGTCPICSKHFPVGEIEAHANKCIFLNSGNDSKRKRSRSRSPNSRHGQSKLDRQKSPGDIVNGKSDDFHVIPLAKQVQPKELEDFFGQEHVFGESTILRTLLNIGDIPNMLLWGPPGCGKTSLASIVHQICRTNPEKLKFVSLNGSSCGTKDVQSVVATAVADLKTGRKTVLFMDEVHKFNKKQQDVFLSPVEQGEIVLIGATTENPSFALNSALLSRCRVVLMEKLDSGSILQILKRAAAKIQIDVFAKTLEGEIESDRIYIEESALKWLADTSDGDARTALNDLEMILKYFNHEGKVITVFDVKEGVKKSHMLYDRKGEEHFNAISAMHKSIRGSDANAALYWTTRMIVSGENPLFIARRLIRAASEDIGEADPQALTLAVSTMHGCQLLGMPESDVLLAQCAVYLANAPKSRKIDAALSKAKKTIAECQGPQPTVPLHLRNAPMKLMKELGYGKPNENGTFMPPELEHVKLL